MAALSLIFASLTILTATNLDHYYGYDTTTDEFGVIAPWYSGQNGQFDFRVRIAAETLKRYPWALPPKSLVAAPEYILNGNWRISPEGEISIPSLRDWDNGDMGQRAAYVISSLLDYYRYSGDAWALGVVSIQADYLVDYCQTDSSHQWPNFLISVPTKGVPYGKCNPDGFIQLDITAEVGLALLNAYKVIGEPRWLEACKNWGDVLAAHRATTTGMPPWNRYANPEQVEWEDKMTGGVVYLLFLFDELIQLGYTGEDQSIVKARDTGLAYLESTLLPAWIKDDTWGRNYWDWWNSVQAICVTDYATRYMMARRERFPNWQYDVRNILTLFLNRTSVSLGSKGDVYSGAWAYPESSGCCGRSLWYGPLIVAPALAEYSARTDDSWARELARRQLILATYDCHENGMVEDNIDGGVIVAKSWFKITHPIPLKYVLQTIAWLPDIAGANKENHIVRTGSVVTDVRYLDGTIAYRTFEPCANEPDILRLSYQPDSVTANGVALSERNQLDRDGYTIDALPGGDFIVSIRHDTATEILVQGEDPQNIADPESADFSGAWQRSSDLEDAVCYQSSESGATYTYRFRGNQVRLLGRYGPDGGLADVFLDDEKQWAPIDCWNPKVRSNQLLYYRNGLDNAEHTLKVVVRGKRNPRSGGEEVYISKVAWSDATGERDYGSGGGPTGTQRMIFGRTERTDYIDSEGNAWRPGVEWVMRFEEPLADIVGLAWWKERNRYVIENTENPEIYRYGIHGPEFWINLTVAPGTYHVRLKFAETKNLWNTLLDAEKRAITVLINGEEQVSDMDLVATADGFNKAVDLVFNKIQPENGAIEVRLLNRHGGEAMLQALEVGPGPGGDGAVPIPHTKPEAT